MADSNEDAARAAIISSFFFTAANLFAGGDGLAGREPTRRADGLIGPPNESPGYYLGDDGRIYPRGTASRTATAQASAAQAPGALVITPQLLLLALVGFLVLRK